MTRTRRDRGGGDEECGGGSGDTQHIERARRPLLPRRGGAVGRSYRWVTAWLIAGAILALLLIANSILDYRFVSRLLSAQQVRRQVTQHVAAFEHSLRQDWTPGTPRLSLLTEEMARSGVQPVWIQLRGPDGTVLEQAGKTGAKSFLRPG